MISYDGGILASGEDAAVSKPYISSSAYRTYSEAVRISVYKYFSLTGLKPLTG